MATITTTWLIFQEFVKIQDFSRVRKTLLVRLTIFQVDHVV
jgi:hypothetical protein